jgi:uncharacterized protein YPO0396
VNQVDLKRVTDQQALPFGGVLAGMRLQSCEILNWGTFHGRVWRFDLRGENALLTGDIGSGKSTLVDAVTTLLVPSNKASYNKAAGAEARERTLASYFLGHYKSERSDVGSSAKPVALRTHKDFSVILGRFRNEAYDQDVTLVQVFWFKDPQGQPDRFYVVADRPLSIAEHFSNFGGEINALRKRLRALPDTEIFATFPLYSAAFRPRFGIDNEQALDLFHQTVSMKSVGNLTEFVRQHMLEGFPVEERVAALVGHFEDLNRAHEAVLKAKKQIQLLQPLIADCDSHAGLVGEVEILRACRDALGSYFADLKSGLLKDRISELDAELARSSERIREFERKRDHESEQRDATRQAIASNGGDRIDALSRDIAGKENLKAERQKRATQYAGLAAQADLLGAADADTFIANAQILDVRIGSSDADLATAQNARVEEEVAMRKLRAGHAELESEIESLKQRRSNIPARILAIRSRVCQELKLAESHLPFAGELIEVRDAQKDWEGAAERVLHAFALSILVSDAHYDKVGDWVNRTHLGERIVYYRVREQRVATTPPVSARSLVHKLAIRSDSTFYGWLDAELRRRFDFACCDNFEQFRREERALTITGQTKGGGGRHEKDDRHRLDDRTRYVLGWSNERKIAALEGEKRSAESQIAAAGGRIAKLHDQEKRLRARLDALKGLALFTNFADLDWKPLAVEIEQLAEERQRLERESDVLRALTEQLAQREQSLATIERRLETARDERTRRQERREQAITLLEQCAAELSQLADAEKSRVFHRLDAKREATPDEPKLTVESCDSREKGMRARLQAEIEAEDRRIGKLRERIVGAMHAYRHAYPLETRETDASIEASGEYRQMLVQLTGDDLPRFEIRFKQLLNENTIREIANFQSQLNRERQTILERIETINRSMKEIDYSPGRFIILLAEPSIDVEIKDFQAALRSCTEGALTGSEDDQYAEVKFLEVKTIIERFRGRDGFADIDRRWTRSVTDVRNWFGFSVSERWRADDTEHEHYSDSGGKSGGQKEKLAYTVLAASLAYQFGLDWAESRSRSFRFVVIDEAFGRGSDESARYGLDLFRKLNLQLMIATPLQKIHVIEPYVAAVGFVHNEDGRSSKLRNMTIEEYLAEKDAHTAASVR